MQPSRRPCICALFALFLPLSLARCVRAETFTITSSPPGATVEVNGTVAGTTPYKIDYPGGYFHKTHSVFGSRLQHSITLRITKDGYLKEEMTVTSGPFDWIAANGRSKGNYFLLKSDHFNVKLQPVSYEENESGGHEPVEAGERDGPIHPHPADAKMPGHANEDRNLVTDSVTGRVSIASTPPGADIFIDGKFAGQTPSKIPLAAGPHHVEVKFQGRQTWQRDLDVPQGSELTLSPILDPSS
jgi:hypothetical protein